MQESQGLLAAMMGTMGLIYLVIFLFIGFCMFKIFQKAGREDAWAGFVPIYNLVVLLDIIGKPVWWLVMFFIPCVNLYFLIVAYIELGKRFGKDTVWSVIFLIFLGIIGLPMLAFGDAQYTPPAQSEE
ncbi:MAG: hypothetical protein JNL32_08145 [Candidatus Kapabacteria bacterium]|nr:hypothetical protein [Candidatus Kapabacteria bacterium]